MQANKRVQAVYDPNATRRSQKPHKSGYQELPAQMVALDSMLNFPKLYQGVLPKPPVLLLEVFFAGS
jgi:hypothetical protein